MPGSTLSGPPGGRAWVLDSFRAYWSLCPGINAPSSLCPPSQQGKPGVPGTKGEKVSSRPGCPGLGTGSALSSRGTLPTGRACLRWPSLYSYGRYVISSGACLGGRSHSDPASGTCMVYEHGGSLGCQRDTCASPGFLRGHSVRKSETPFLNEGVPWT